jgi:hypothetical protein
MSHVKKILALAALGLASSAGAATLTLTPVVTQYYDAAFTPLPTPVGNSAAGIYEIHYKLTVAGINPAAQEVGVGNFAFKINLPTAGNSLKNNVDAPGWAANNPFVDINGVAPPNPPSLNVPAWARNSDIGASTSDLDGITIGVAANTIFGANDPRQDLGEPTQNTYTNNSGLGPPPLDVGSIFVTYDGSARGGPVDPTHDITAVSQGMSLHFTDGSNTEVTGQPGQTFTIGSVQFGATVPEPTSLSLLALGGLVAARRRRA